MSIFLLSFLSLVLFAQEKAIVFGKVSQENGQPVEYANVAVLGYAGGVATDLKGKFELSVPALTELDLVITFIGFENKMYRIYLQPGQREELTVIMKSTAEELDPVDIHDKQIRHTNLQRLSPKIASEIPTLSGGVEDIISYCDKLESDGLLKRVNVEVDPVLEIAEIMDRLVKDGGPAVLFENVK